METFFSVLAWIFLIIAVIRLIGVYFGAKENAGLIRLAEAMGEYPIHDALKLPIITIIVCLAWLFTV